MKNQKTSAFRENLGLFLPGILLLAITIIVLLCLRQFVGTLSFVIGKSMIPTFQSGDLILVSKVKDSTELNRGDIVLVKHADKILIKRIYALPGETIGDTQEDAEIGINPVTLGDNEYYIVGDNRSASMDSRYFGPVSDSEILYKDIGIHWTPINAILTLFIPEVLLVLTILYVITPYKPRMFEKLYIDDTDGAECANDNDGTAEPDSASEKTEITQKISQEV